MEFERTPEVRVASSPYTGRDLVRVASRLNNKKRSYLLVNPLQGKHVPADPAIALSLGSYLGAGVRAMCPDARIVIGFSETATAIGQCAADAMGGGTFFVQTTREPDAPGERWVEFEEEHSHATAQRLCVDMLENATRGCSEIVLVDDEISTGKTVLNLALRLREALPSLDQARFVVASLVNRLDNKRVLELAESGISFISLVHLAAVGEPVLAADRYETAAPVACEADPVPEGPDGEMFLDMVFPDPRYGSELRVAHDLRQMAQIVRTVAGGALGGHVGRLLVLGTEECMYVPMLLANGLQTDGIADRVQFHATTRSPIAVCSDPNYPIWNGYRLPSLYDVNRESFLYDVEQVDCALICTDSQHVAEASLAPLCGVLREHGCRSIIVVRIGYADIPLPNVPIF